MLFSDGFLSVVLTFASKVAKVEVVATEAIMNTSLWSIKDGEGEVRWASNVDFIEARPVTVLTNFLKCFSMSGRWTS